MGLFRRADYESDTTQFIKQQCDDGARNGAQPLVTGVFEPAAQPHPAHQQGQRAQCHQQGGQVEGVQMGGQSVQHAKKIGGHRVDLQAQEVLDLREHDQHRNAIGEADHHRHGDEANQRTEPEQPHQEQDGARHGRGQDQVGQAVAFQNAVDDDDESPGGATDLYPAATQRRNQKACDDGGEQSGLWLEPGSNRKGHGQWQRHHADGDAGAHVTHERGTVITRQAVEEFGTKEGSVQLHRGGSMHQPTHMKLSRTAFVIARLDRGIDGSSVQARG